MKVLNLGQIDYLEAHHIQKDLVENLYCGKAEEALIVCSHPSVVTLGKKSTKEDLLSWSGPVYEIERGGQATYHGPGQIVIYPIINLKNRGQNIAGFLESLEQSMIQVCKDFNLEAAGNDDRGKPDFTGVWVQGKKIASIGIAVKRWVTYHGLAFNLERDPNFFQGINPCGFSTEIMTSLNDLVSQELEREKVEELLCSYLIKSLNELA